MSLCLYLSLSAQRVSAEGSSKVQLQLILVSETQLNFHFTGVRDKALTQRNQCKELLQRMLQQVTISHHTAHKILPQLRYAL